MQNRQCKDEFGLAASVLTTLCALLAALGALLAAPGTAWALTGQPLVYVSNNADNTISVIDTGTNKVVDTIPGISGDLRVAPDGKRLYVFHGGLISIIETRTDKVTSTIPLPGGFLDVSPDTKRLYRIQGADLVVVDLQSNTVLATIPVPTTIQNGVTVTDLVDNLSVASTGQRVYLTTHSAPDSTVSVIDTRTNTVVRTLKPGNWTVGGTETPDGKFVYFFDRGASSSSLPFMCSSSSADVTVFDTATGQRVATIGGAFLRIPVVTPNGARAYVVSGNVCQGVFGSFTVLDTATNKVLGAPIPVGFSVGAPVVTPDGTRVYVAHTRRNEPISACTHFIVQRCTTFAPDHVSVIDTGTGIVVATVPVGNVSAPGTSVPPSGSLAIVPPPQGVPFAAFAATLDRRSTQNVFDLRTGFTLSSDSDGIDPGGEPVKLQIGPYIATIPAGSLAKGTDGVYRFEGNIELVRERLVHLQIEVAATGDSSYTLLATASGVSAGTITRPVQVSMSIGDDAGLATVEVQVASGP